MAARRPARDPPPDAAHRGRPWRHAGGARPAAPLPVQRCGRARQCAARIGCCHERAAGAAPDRLRRGARAVARCALPPVAADTARGQRDRKPARWRGVRPARRQRDRPRRLGRRGQPAAARRGGADGGRLARRHAKPARRPSQPGARQPARLRARHGGHAHARGRLAAHQRAPFDDAAAPARLAARGHLRV